MKLRAGIPPWLPPPERSRAGSSHLTGSLECDVAIVGGGITGTLVAHELLQAGLSVVLLDKRHAGLGSTAASTGLLLYQPDTSLADLSRRHRRRAGQRVFALGREAIHELAHLVRRLRIACGWKVRRTLYVASRPQHLGRLQDEAIRARRIGFQERLLSPAALERRYGFSFPGALLAAGAAEVNALALTRGVLHRCRQHGNFRLFERTHVRSVRERKDGVTLRTERGEVRARHAIIAAGYEAGTFVRTRLVRLRSTYVIASRPFPAKQLAPLRCLMWETARPYFYLRTTPDRRIVFGGQDGPFVDASHRDRQLRAKTHTLERQFAALFPALAFRAEYAWTGTFAETSDGLPCIGPIRRGSRVLYALGYGGNGITFSQVAAKLLRDTCLGRTNADAALFAFDRRGRRRM